MTALQLQPSTAVLTKTVTTKNPNDATQDIVVSFPCDLTGNPLPSGTPGLPVYRDLFTCKTWVRIAELIPSGTASADVERANGLKALNPVHFTNGDGSIRGYFVPAPDFNQREAVAVAA